MTNNTRERILEELIIDLTNDIHSWKDLENRTGLSEERCKEMFEQIKESYTAYNGRNNVIAPKPDHTQYIPSPILKYFTYSHLPLNLQVVSEQIAKLAEQMDVYLVPSAEKSAGLRKLLEAKDCFVRAALEK